MSTVSQVATVEQFRNSENCQVVRELTELLKVRDVRVEAVTKGGKAPDIAAATEQAERVCGFDLSGHPFPCCNGVFRRNQGSLRRGWPAYENELGVRIHRHQPSGRWLLSDVTAVPPADSCATWQEHQCYAWSANPWDAVVPAGEQVCHSLRPLTPPPPVPAPHARTCVGLACPWVGYVMYMYSRQVELQQTLQSRQIRHRTRALQLTGLQCITPTYITPVLYRDRGAVSQVWLCWGAGVGWEETFLRLEELLKPAEREREREGGLACCQVRPLQSAA